MATVCPARADLVCSLYLDGDRLHISMLVFGLSLRLNPLLGPFCNRTRFKRHRLVRGLIRTELLNQDHSLFELFVREA
ncbi:MAG: hypothetical protein EBV89_12185 [Betaproteobacteria bacterium]|nr:hypothetical protein [Betaproteobacteria bacterium]